MRDLLSRGPIAQSLWKGKDLFLKNVPLESGLHFRFPVPGLDKNRWLPQPAARPFLDEPERKTRSETSGPRVALFIGCVSNFLRPETARAAVRVLEAAGAQVVIPRDQVCCGKPAAGAGDQETAAYLAQKNLAALDTTQFDYLTTFCATCTEQLKHYDRIIGNEAGHLSGKVKDLSELLVHVLNWGPETAAGHPDPLRVFYHDPCHLRRKQGIFREPRQLLQALPGVQTPGADDPPVCCGYGGLFNLWQYPLSQDLFRVRLENILSHQPDLVVTSCSGCWLQFEDQLRAAGNPFPVLPLVELLAERGLPS
jgi:glycolate oxidase iron-sulfur subunit